MNNLSGIFSAGFQIYREEIPDSFLRSYFYDTNIFFGIFVDVEAEARLV